MKEINECIGNIGRANSSIFSMLDLTTGFWQMKLEEESQPLMAFTIPGWRQFHWITSPMGLLRCPASFQQLMEQVLRGLQNDLIYIDGVLIYTDTHEKHLEVGTWGLCRQRPWTGYKQCWSNTTSLPRTGNNQTYQKNWRWHRITVKNWSNQRTWRSTTRFTQLFEKPGQTGPMVLSITDGSLHYGWKVKTLNIQPQP